MSSPALDALLVELAQARDELDMPMGGLRNLLAIDMPAEIDPPLNEHLSFLTRRRDLLVAAIAALDALAAHGYPDVPLQAISSGYLQRMQQELAETHSAIRRFVSQIEATQARINLERDDA